MACVASTALRNCVGVQGSPRAFIILGQRSFWKPASGVLYLHLQRDRANSQRSSPPANGPDGQRIFASQLDLLHFMADHKAFTLTQRVPHLLQTDFDFQKLAAVRQGKSKYSVVLRRAAWPER